LAARRGPTPVSAGPEGAQRDVRHHHQDPVARAETHPLRPIVAELTATRDRQALFRNRRFRRQVFEALDELALTHDGTPGLLSLDVFDTLLLRDGSSQVRRFGEIGARMAARAGPGTTAEDALIARHLGTRASYRAGPRVDGCGEGSLARDP
jgi:hypothetical protein